MTAKEYLLQARHLDQRINSDIRESGELRRMAENISASSFNEKVRGSCPHEARFARAIEKVVELEEKINREIDLFVDLKEEIRNAIDAMADHNEKMVLRNRYIDGFTWEQIGEELHADPRTIRRWHEKALAHIALPDNPTVV